MTNSMRIKEIRTHKLFGVFDHVIPLNMDDRITIIHGPNGFGKTAILRMVSSVSDQSYGALRTLPFAGLELEFNDDKTLAVMQLDHNEEDAGKWPELEFEFPPNSSFVLKRDSKYLTYQDFSISQIHRVVPELERFGPEEWLSQATGEVFDFGEVIERFGHLLPNFQSEKKGRPSWLTQIGNALDVCFVQVNRLEHPGPFPRPGRGRHESRFVVARFARELAEHIQATLADYAEVSQKLDRTFPQRLVSRPAEPRQQIEHIRKKLARLEQKRDQLTAAGLLDKLAHFDAVSEVDASKGDVLSVYIDDVERKLAVFDKLYEKIDRFLSILNRRFLFKTVSVNKTDGIVFETRDGNILLPESLSSGEQHEVVLLYQLLFKVKPNSLILIDEPELSLHITWQEQFLKDLALITKLSNFDVLIATHSPEIISDRWDLTVELKRPPECSNTSQPKELPIQSG